MALNIRILVVDDFSTIRRLLRKMLKDLNLTNVVEADDGTTAWEILQKDQIDMVVSDWNMPKMQGIELLEKVRGDDRFKHLPFIMVTAEAQKEQVIEATRKGVTGYIVKPFTLDTMKQKLTQAVQAMKKK